MWANSIRSLYNPNFRKFWIGQIVSQTGTWMQIVAQSWVIYRLTDSPFMLGLVNFVGLFPVVPISLFAGVISDRYPKKILIIITESILMLQALCMAILLWLELIQVWHIIVLSFILGAAAAIEQPARLAFVAEIVGKEDLTNAVALNSSAFNTARIIGPAIAGTIVATFGEAGCFLLNGISFLAIIIALIQIDTPYRSSRSSNEKIATSLLDGFHYMWQTASIRGLLLIVIISSFLTLPYITFMPVFARDILNVGSQGLGWLMSSIGLGAIIGALWMASLKPGFRGKWLVYANIIAPVLLIIFCLSQSFMLSIVLVACLGISNSMRQILSNSLLQTETAPNYQGRVMSIFNILVNGMSRIGALIIGWLADYQGVTLALSISGFFSFIVGGIFIFTLTSVNRIK